MLPSDKIVPEFNIPWFEVSERDIANHLYLKLSLRQQFYARLLIEPKALNELISIAKEARKAFSDFEVFPSVKNVFDMCNGLNIEQRSLRHFWFNQMTKDRDDPIIKQYIEATKDIIETMEYNPTPLSNAWNPYLPPCAKEEKQCIIM
jgi:hypothetical protein